MSSDTNENPVKVVLDTNVLISAIAFGGKPEEVLNLVLEEKIIGLTSPILLAEFKEVYRKKFQLRAVDFELTVKNIEEMFEILQPKKTLEILNDDDDNRVLEAAIEGECSYIITGDTDLLTLKKYHGIIILTPDEFLRDFRDN